jgi:YidC/Oxa1 family membrane protein insertase
VEPNGTQTQESKLFIGRQDDETILRPISPGFELIKDYGRLTIILQNQFFGY